MAGCGCGGSKSAKAATQTRRDRESTQQPREAARRVGGPGSKGYTWNGPKRSAPASE